MVEPHKIFGRLGNQMFQFATITALACETQTDIYFQDEKWFIKFEPVIRKMFGAGIGSRPEVSIHVRRGDYLKLELYTNLADNTDYYERAMAMFPPDTKYLVFSDDIEYCKNRFVGDQFSFSEGLNEVQDLNQMASCKHNIIANSTFSWWAAWLNPNPDKIIISPERSHWGSKIVLPDNFKQI